MRTTKGGSRLILAQRYEVLGTLGEGAFGVVYRCRDQKLDREVALKLLKRTDSQEARDRFLREGRLASRLDHPHVVRTLDQGITEDGSPFLVSEIVEGESLDARLESRERIAIAQARTWFGQLLEGLEAAHRAGIAHRDIKPANVMLSKDGALLADFGLAYAPEEHPLTATGHLVGTPGYMAPETLTQDRPDERSDLWAMGALGYELFYGQRWRTKLDAACLEEERRRPPVPDPERFGRYPDLDPVLARLLAGDPAARPASPGEALAELQGERRPSRPLPGDPGCSTGPESRRPGARILLPGILAVGLVGALLNSRPETPREPEVPPPSERASGEPETLTRVRTNLLAALESPQGIVPEDLRYLPNLSDPAFPLRWRRFLNEVFEAERSRVAPPDEAWLSDAVAATRHVAFRIHTVDVGVQQLVLDQALGSSFPGDVRQWKLRRQELHEVATAALEQARKDLDTIPSPAFVAHVFELGTMVQLPEPSRWLDLSEGLTKTPGAGEMVLSITRYHQLGRALAQDEARRSLRHFVDWVEEHPLGPPELDVLEGLTLLAGAILRSQYPEPEPATLDRFDRLVEAIEARAGEAPGEVERAFQKIHGEMGRETIAGLLAGADEISWEPYLARRRRIRALRDLQHRRVTGQTP